MLKQFLRILLAANMERSERGQDTKALRARLLSGETIEVAGYSLTPALAMALEAVELAAFPPPPSVKVDWFELVADGGLGPPPAVRSAAQSWRKQGSRTSLWTSVGEPFWSLQEITVAAGLIEATSALFEPENDRR
jgi:hypothetical protein